MRGPETRRELRPPAANGDDDPPEPAAAYAPANRLHVASARKVLAFAGYRVTQIQAPSGVLLLVQERTPLNYVG